VEIEVSDGTREVSVERIRSNPFQPRTVFDPKALEELADSIRENGLIQPLVVRVAGDGLYELIAGERRYLACKQAGLTNVPVVVRQASRREMLEVALVENLQREDLNAIEEAEAYQRLATEFGLTQEEIAGRVGKSRTSVTNALRLLSLEEGLRNLIVSGALSAGHARALLALPAGNSRRKLAGEIQDRSLSVRQAEARVQGGPPKRAKPTAKKRSHQALEAWEDRLRDRFATQVRIVGGLARGRVELHYFNHEDLERILELVGVGSDL
jgi:ParB family chromosome partitioning protein